MHLPPMEPLELMAPKEGCEGGLDVCWMNAWWMEGRRMDGWIDNGWKMVDGRKMDEW